MNRFRVTLTALLATGALAACVGESTTDQSTTDPGETTPLTDATIEVLDNDFSPEQAEVTAGSTVDWDFGPADNVHNVVFDDGPSSDIMNQGTWSRDFDEPGTYPYECTLHSGMDGAIVVVDQT